MKAKEPEIKIVPLLRVTWPGGAATIDTFDRAWHFARTRPIPNITRLIEWVRVDD